MLHICLYCTRTLQRALDAKFTVAEWQGLSAVEALDTVGRLALQATNQAAEWCRFFAISQLPDESISEYFMRSAQCAADCEFQCLNCDGNLTDYVLPRKLMSSLYSVVLREKVFRKFASFSDVDSLRSYCNAFEAAHKDASMGYGGKGSVAREGAVATATDPLPNVGDSGWVPEAAATNTRHLDNPRKCGNCGRPHLPKKLACPAEKLVCHNCSKTGHLAVMC